MKKSLFAATIFAILLGPHVALAQNDFGLELRAGATNATHKLGGSKLEPGITILGIADYRFLPHLGAYAGWGWAHFSADESFAGNNTDFEETGYMLGLDFNHPIGTGPLAYYLRGGGIYNHIETEKSTGDIVDDTGHGWGWQLEGGVDYDLGRNWHLKPSVKFQSLSREIRIQSVTTQADLRYVSISLGIARRF